MTAHVIILAAGNSTRLKSQLTKVLHPLCGRPMIDYVLAAARSVRPKKISVVVGHGHEALQEHLQKEKNLVLAHQKQRLGTAHAVQVGLKALGKVRGEVLILNGDTPLLSARTLRQLLRASPKNPLAFLTAVLPNPTGYGRVVRDTQGQVLGIVEEVNATPAQRQLNEINSGVYRVQLDFLEKNLKRIKKDPIKKEFYLTDLVALAVAGQQEVATVPVRDSHEILGVNTRAELAYVNEQVREAIVAHHLSQGVGMQDPNAIYVDEGVKIGADTFLGAGVQLLGKTRIGPNCVIEAGCVLKDARLEAGVELKAYSYLEDCILKPQAVVGPFARVRPGSVVGVSAKVGNFVELKKTHLGEGSKASHLTYLGDTKVGKGANIGAGTITCNYDGKRKFPTTIGDGAFIGSDVQLVAPVKVDKGAYVGAGTTVTKDVPKQNLALSRVPQRNVKRKR